MSEHSCQDIEEFLAAFAKLQDDYGIYLEEDNPDGASTWRPVYQRHDELFPMVRDGLTCPEWLPIEKTHRFTRCKKLISHEGECSPTREER